MEEEEEEEEEVKEKRRGEIGQSREESGEWVYTTTTTTTTTTTMYVHQQFHDYSHFYYDSFLFYNLLLNEINAYYRDLNKPTRPRIIINTQRLPPGHHLKPSNDKTE